MSRDDVTAAWRLFQLNWIPLAGMGAALALALALTRFSIEASGLAVSLGFRRDLCRLCLRQCAVASATRSASHVRGSAPTAQIVLVTVMMSPLTYVAAAADFRCKSSNLLALDRALPPGLERPTLTFVDGHPALAAWLGLRLHHDQVADLRHSGDSGGGAIATGGCRNSLWRLRLP